MFVYLYLQVLYINSNFFTRKKWFHVGTQFKTPQGLSGGSGSTQIPTPAPRSWPWLQPQRFTCSSLNEIHQLSILPVSPPPSFYIDNAYWFPKLQFKHPLLVEAFPDHQTKSLLPSSTVGALCHVLTATRSLCPTSTSASAPTTPACGVQWAPEWREPYLQPQIQPQHRSSENLQNEQSPCHPPCYG